MGFTGDALTITSDKRFVRIDSLQIGDRLLSPSGEEIIIKEINSNYNNCGYVLKLKNFFPIYVSKETDLFTTKILSIYDKTIKKNRYLLKEFSFNNISNIKQNNLAIINKMDNKEDKSLNNIWLYGKSLLKGKASNKIKNQIIINNTTTNIRNYENNVKDFNNVFYGKNNSYKKLFINLKEKELWFEMLNKNLHQRFLEKDIFDLKQSDVELFLNSFIKENTEMFISNNQFKIYIPSKILITQLFYLMLQNYNKAPNIELIKKNNWETKEIKQSNKKRLFSITYHQELKTSFKKKDYFIQEIDYVSVTNRNLKYFEIKTEDNKPFYLYNLIVKG